MAELSRLSGVSERRLRDIENGHGQPRETTLYRILNALNALPRRRRKIEYELDDIFPPPRPRAG
jgi:transcriptional regulator with XRE-family HTH domain